MLPIPRSLPPLSSLTVLNLLKRKKLRKMKEKKNQLNCSKKSLKIIKKNLLLLLDRKSTMKKLMYLTILKLTKRKLLVSNLKWVTSTQDMLLRKTSKSVTVSILLNVDLKEVSFPVDKNKELPLQELSSESQRFFFLMRLLLL